MYSISNNCSIHLEKKPTFEFAKVISKRIPSREAALPRALKRKEAHGIFLRLWSKPIIEFFSSYLSAHDVLQLNTVIQHVQRLPDFRSCSSLVLGLHDDGVFRCAEGGRDARGAFSDALLRWDLVLRLPLGHRDRSQVVLRNSRRSDENNSYPHPPLQRHC